MGITQLEIQSPLRQVLYLDSGIGNLIDGVRSAPGILYSVAVDNTQNAAPTFVKLWDLNSASVLIGTTAPDWVLKVLPNLANVFYFSGATSQGVPFNFALSACAVTSGGTGGTTSPTNPVKVTIAFSRVEPL